MIALNYVFAAMPYVIAVGLGLLVPTLGVGERAAQAQQDIQRTARSRLQCAAYQVLMTHGNSPFG